MLELEQRDREFIGRVSEALYAHQGLGLFEKGEIIQWLVHQIIEKNKKAKYASIRIKLDDEYCDFSLSPGQKYVFKNTETMLVNLFD